MVVIMVVAGIALAAGCGSVKEPPDASISDATPGSDGQSCTQACLSDTSLRECTGGERTVACPLGCVAAEARCRTLVPSNGVSTEHLQDVTGVLSIPDDAQVIVDTDVGSITVGEQSLRGPGVGVNQGIGFQYTDDDLSVLAVQGMTMGARSYLRARGVRPLLILSAGDVEIAGTIDVSAGCDTGTPAQLCGGPGGGRGADAQNVATGCGGGSDGTAQGIFAGGGGGGFGQAGGTGGGGTSAGQACQASLVPLQGGSGGGRSASTTGDGGGGGGGGAVQISSYTAIRLVSPAVIDAGGSGGAGGSVGGGGGGAGGGILLEAPVLSIDGAILAANGGGGGSYTTEGEDGYPDVLPAPGGTTGGGVGGALADAPGNGTIYVLYGYGYSSSFGGGGGGGAGMIHIRAPLTSYSATNTRTSPAPVRLDPDAN